MNVSDRQAAFIKKALASPAESRYPAHVVEPADVGGLSKPDASKASRSRARAPAGLKDHHIAALVNAIRTDLQNIPGHAGLTLCHYGPLRERISGAVLRYLEAEGLRIDKP